MIIDHHLFLKKGQLSVRTLSSDDDSTLTKLATDSRIWEHEQSSLDLPEVFQEKWLSKAKEKMQLGQRWPFVVAYEEKIVGSSSFYNIDEKNRSLHIGYTWYHPNVWGTSINTTTKLMLLEYAFEKLNFIRVAFSVDQANLRSCRALKKLGAQQEGILRKHRLRADGSHRNSVIFSIYQQRMASAKNPKA